MFLPKARREGLVSSSSSPATITKRITRCSATPLRLRSAAGYCTAIFGKGKRGEHGTLGNEHHAFHRLGFRPVRPIHVLGNATRKEGAMICHHCGKVIEGDYVSFKHHGCDDWFYFHNRFHNGEGKDCWELYLFAHSTMKINEVGRTP